MSHRGGRGDGRTRGHPRNVGVPPARQSPCPPDPIPGRVKRRKTKRERDMAKFGQKRLVSGCRRAGAPPHRLPSLWGGHPPRSPLPAPKTVVITQKRLCQHRGMFNHELEGGGPAAEQPPLSPPEVPRNLEETGVPSLPSLRDLATQLSMILGRIPAFPGRDLVDERRRSILSALLQRHRIPLDLTFLLAHRNQGAEAASPGGWRPRTPEPEPEQVDFGGHKQSWDTTPPFSGTPGPLRVIMERTPPCATRLDTPSPIFGGDGKERESPFSWTSAEEDDTHPAPLFQPRVATPEWGDRCRHGGTLPSSPLAHVPTSCTCGCPSCDDAGEGCSWSHRPPIAPPAFSPLAPRQHRTARRAGTTTVAPRCPELRREANLEPPEASQRLVPGWLRAKRRVPCCRHHHLLQHNTSQHDLVHNDPARHDSLWNDPVQHDLAQQRNLLWNDPEWRDPLWHNPLRNDPVQHDLFWHNPRRHDPLRHDPVPPSVLQGDPLRYDTLRNDPLRHDVLQNDPMQYDVLQSDLMRREVLQSDPMQHDMLWNNLMWHDELRNDPIRHDVLRNDPMRCDMLRHISHHPRQPLAPPSPGGCRWPPPLEHRAAPESCRHRGREEHWAAPEPGRRWGLGEPGWLRAPQHLPLAGFAAAEVPERNRSPVPRPESWSCSCAGLY
ncbi:proline-rich protein 19 isoform X2 [Cuculus canorus]|uniref:proline-rich protein 19 isoform X2 n=1 Tax=Cuculus canorus TaxID=55661 RepID=UPI0023AA430E|nr:proline-rich protein 19 isoform X2 [Cuculus canorus]